MGFEYTVNGNDKGLSYIFLEQAKKLDGFDESKQIDWNQVMNVFDEIQQEKQAEQGSLFEGDMDKTKKGYGNSYKIKKDDKIVLTDAQLNKIYKAMGVDLNKSQNTSNRYKVLTAQDAFQPQKGDDLSNKTLTLDDIEKTTDDGFQNGEKLVGNRIYSYENGLVTSSRDKDNKTSRMIIRNADGSVAQINDYKNDANGKPVQMYIYDKNGKLTEIRGFVNGANGRALRTISRKPNGEVQNYTDWQYDSSNNLTRATERKSDGSVLGVYEHQYKDIKDEKGNITGKYEYEIDALNKDRVVRQTKKDNNDNVVTIYEYSYDSSGRNIKQLEKNADGKVVATHEYELDASGQTTKHVKKDPKGNIKCSYEYEYDSSGRETKQIEKDSNGNVTSYYVCTEWDTSTKDPIKWEHYDAKGHKLED